MLSWIVEMGEARLVQLAEELLANPTMAETFSAALHRAARTKGQVDRNMQMLLGLLNVPGIMMSIITGLLLIVAIATPLVIRKLAARRA